MNKLLQSILIKTVKNTLGNLYRHTICKMRFASQYHSYPVTFDRKLTNQLDEMIPDKSDYFCQSVKLLSTEDLNYHNNIAKNNKIFQDNYKDFHVFAYTECCAYVIVNRSHEVCACYVDDDVISQHHKFLDIKSFLEAACIDKVDDTSNPLILP